LNRTLKLAAALLFAALAFPHAARAAQPSITVYADDSFRGGGRTFQNGVSNLEQFGLNDRISSVVVHGGSWRLCDNANLMGPCITLNPGSYPRLSAWGLNDKVSSLAPVGWNGGPGPGPGYPGPGYPGPNPGNCWNNNCNGGNNGGWVGPGYSGAVVLYDHDNFQGDSRNISSAINNLQSIGFSYRASSLIIHRGRWLLCQGPNFSGRCITLGVGRVGRLSNHGMNDQIASLRPI
jgi:hypothetical protein